MKRDLSSIDRNIGQMWSRIIQEAFAHGITNDMVYGGLEPGQTALQGIHAAPVATQNCRIGTRRVSWDGKVFRYAKAAGNVSADYLAYSAHTYQALNWSAVVSGALGAKSCVVTVGATDGDGAGAIALNYLKDGYILFLNTLVGSFSLGITGNTLTKSTGPMTITLDEALPILLTNSMKVEAMGNPYAELEAKANCPADVSMVGIATREATLTLLYHWQQTWGPCWVTPNNGFQTLKVGDSNFNSQVVVWNGTCGVHRDAAAAAQTDYQQHIGFVISRTQAGITQGAPFIMLQICP